MDETAGGQGEGESGGTATDAWPGASGGDEGGCACRASTSPRGAAWGVLLLVLGGMRNMRTMRLRDR